ncbi:MAG: hypothetical protein ACLGHQ_05805, partial [Acidimicrobiia bacterium]
MRRVLGRLATVAVLGSSVLTVGTTAWAQDSETETTSTETTEASVVDASTSSTSTTSTTPTTSTTTTTTTTAPPLVGELSSGPSRVVPDRGTQIQVTDTQPP